MNIMISDYVRLPLEISRLRPADFDSRIDPDISLRLSFILILGLSFTFIFSFVLTLSFRLGVD